MIVTMNFNHGRYKIEVKRNRDDPEVGLHWSTLEGDSDDPHGAVYFGVRNLPELELLIQILRLIEAEEKFPKPIPFGEPSEFHAAALAGGGI
jgi:hypothetical protein